MVQIVVAIIAQLSSHTGVVKQELVTLVKDESAAPMRGPT